VWRASASARFLHSQGPDVSRRSVDRGPDETCSNLRGWALIGRAPCWRCGDSRRFGIDPGPPLASGLARQRGLSSCGAELVSPGLAGAVSVPHHERFGLGHRWGYLRGRASRVILAKGTRTLHGEGGHHRFLLGWRVRLGARSEWRIRCVRCQLRCDERGGLGAAGLRLSHRCQLRGGRQFTPRSSSRLAGILRRAGSGQDDLDHHPQPSFVTARTPVRPLPLRTPCPPPRRRRQQCASSRPGFRRSSADPGRRRRTNWIRCRPR
jgi:hypothetical protein